MCDSKNSNKMVYILSFIDKDIKVIGDMGCILLKEINDCIHTENESFKINVKQFNSEYFKRFIMDEELDRDELNVQFSTNLKTGPYYEFINYSKSIYIRKSSLICPIKGNYIRR